VRWSVFVNACRLLLTHADDLPICHWMPIDYGTT
jgi:hypothetical protein